MGKANIQSWCCIMASTNKSPRRPISRWSTLKGLTALLLFLLVIGLIEFAVVLYAINLGIQGQVWTLTVTLFFLIPVGVTITLASSWAYLTEHVPVKLHREKRKGKAKLKGVENSFWSEIHLRTLKSALIIISTFITFILIFSLLCYPQLIYWNISHAYQTNSSLPSLIKGITNALKPISQVFSPVNNALINAAPAFRGFVLSFSSPVRFLATLDNIGKYIFFQNAAAWISAFTVLIYVAYRRKSYRRYRYRRR